MLLLVIHYWQCCCYRWFIIAEVVDTGVKLIAGVMESMIQDKAKSDAKDPNDNLSSEQQHQLNQSPMSMASIETEGLGETDSWKKPEDKNFLSNSHKTPKNS